jgi:hypothetical protein
MVALLKSLKLQWMGVEQKRRLMKLHWKWALNINVPMDGFYFSRRDGT